MISYLIVCTGCGKERMGEKHLDDGEVRPYSRQCPNCGAVEFTVPAFD
jgi:hypothetical protein